MFVILETNNLKKVFNLIFEDVINLVKQKGFNTTFDVLAKFDQLETDIHTFYSELNKISYYNSFFRIKEELIKRGIIEIKKRKKKTIIKLTIKGVLLLNSLKSMERLINSNHQID